MSKMLFNIPDEVAETLRQQSALTGLTMTQFVLKGLQAIFSGQVRCQVYVESGERSYPVSGSVFLMRVG